MQSFSFASHLGSAFRNWWSEHRQREGCYGAGALLMRELWGFLRDSTPERRRQRYGDMEFDWEHRVNTSSGTLTWRERLLGVFLSPYQPTDPVIFDEMMKSLAIDFREFAFIDLGSGKGRTLLMASKYPFRRIIGVEIVPELHRAAEENVHIYHERRVEKQIAASRPAANQSQIECICADALTFDFPAEPIVLYLFNPVSEAGLTRVIENLDRSLREHPRKVYILYHNPLLEKVPMSSAVLDKVGGTQQFSVYANQV